MPIFEDVERDEYLRNSGWKVLRFPNHKVLSARNEVIRKKYDLKNIRKRHIMNTE